MAGKVTPAYLRALEVLADGAWHERDQVVSEVAQVVPPGQAWRRAERNRARPGRPAERIHGDQFEVIRSGARSVAWDVLRGLVRFGKVERDGDRVRLR